MNFVVHGIILYNRAVHLLFISVFFFSPFSIRFYNTYVYRYPLFMLHTSVNVHGGTVLAFKPFPTIILRIERDVLFFRLLSLSVFINSRPLHGHNEFGVRNREEVAQSIY